MWCGLLISSSLLLKVECILTSYSKFTSLLLKMQTHYCRWAKHFDILRVANNISHVACWKWLEAHSLKNNVLLHAGTCLHIFWSEKKIHSHYLTGTDLHQQIQKWFSYNINEFAFKTRSLWKYFFQTRVQTSHMYYLQNSEPSSWERCALV